MKNARITRRPKPQFTTRNVEKWTVFFLVTHDVARTNMFSFFFLGRKETRSLLL
jgi:hypothetical protein